MQRFHNPALFCSPDDTPMVDWQSSPFDAVMSLPSPVRTEDRQSEPSPTILTLPPIPRSERESYRSLTPNFNAVDVLDLANSMNKSLGSVELVGEGLNSHDISAFRELLLGKILGVEGRVHLQLVIDFCDRVKIDAKKQTRSQRSGSYTSRLFLQKRVAEVSSYQSIIMAEKGRQMVDDYYESLALAKERPHEYSKKFRQQCINSAIFPRWASSASIDDMVLLEAAKSERSGVDELRVHIEAEKPIWSLCEAFGRGIIVLLPKSTRENIALIGAKKFQALLLAVQDELGELIRPICRDAERNILEPFIEGRALPALGILECNACENLSLSELIKIQQKKVAEIFETEDL